jgi:outer membrane protein
MKSSWITSLLLCLAGWSFGQTAELSLADALEIGLANHLGLRIAENEMAIAENNNHWGTAGRYPSVQLNLGSNNGFNSTVNPASFLREFTSLNTTALGSIDANWILFDGHRVRLTKEQLELLERNSQGMASLVVETVIRDIILSYYQARIEQEQLGVVEEVLRLSNDRLEYDELRREYGQASTFDVLQTRDALLNDSTTYVLQLNTWENALRNLNLALGLDDMEQRFQLTDALEVALEDYDLPTLRERMLRNNISLNNLQINRQLARLNTDLAEAARKPIVSLGTGAIFNTNLTQINADNPFTGEPFGAVNGRTFNYYFNVTLSYNLFDAGVRRRNIENAQVLERNALLGTEDFQRLLFNQLATTLATYNSQRRVVLMTKDLVENARKNLSIAEERFRGGLINAFDYRTIQLGYVNASQRQLQAIFELKTTETELIRLTGGLVR